MTILGVQILPSLAIARLGASPNPLDNYELVVESPLGYRTIKPGETLIVDERTGAIIGARVPDKIVFRDGAKIRPVAPFLEVFALTDRGKLEPLTLALLTAEGLKPQDISWTVSVGNIKAFRRTGNPDDKIQASASFNDHRSYALEGKCANFLPGKVLPLGSARYIKPTPQFSEIRLRFTPAAGLVYGASRTRIPSEGAAPVTDDVVKDRVIYDGNKSTGKYHNWKGYSDPGLPTDTNPAQIYAGYSTSDGQQISWGYLDDECDGTVEVTLNRGNRPSLTAFARIGAGPPAFAPDSLPIRTVADDLAQALFGPDVDPADATPEAVEDILRRAYETVRLLNTAVMNGNPVDGRLAPASIMPSQDSNDTHRLFGPIMTTTLVDSLSIVALHQSVLTALKSGTPPWFADVLRRPEDVGDLTDKGRRKMPAMMRGADGRYLSLTRRQIDVIVKSAERGLVQGGLKSS